MIHSFFKYLKIGLPALWAIGCLAPAQAQRLLTLEQSRQLALRQNARIVIQNDSIAVARLGVERAKTHALPSVDASASGLYLGRPLNKYLPEWSESASGTAQEVIYAGGKVRTGVKAAQLNVEVQNLQQVRNKADVITATDSAYWQVVSLKEQLATLTQSRAYLASSLKDVTNAYQAGARFKNDVLQVQVQYNQNELQLLKATNGLKLAKLNLLQVTGLSLRTPVDVPDTVPFSPVALLPDSAYDRNADRRPEVQLLSKSVEAGDLQTRLAAADRLPQVAVSAIGLYSHSSTPGIVNLLGTYLGSSASTASSSLAPIGLGSNSGIWLAMVSARVPVFHWGDYRKAVTQQEIRARARRTELNDGRQKVVLDIRRSYNNLTEAEKNVGYTSLSVVQATENLRLATDRLKAGTITATDWLQAQTLWQQSRTQATTARVDYNNYLTQFKKATGELE